MEAKPPTSRDAPPAEWAALVPELNVRDLERSLAFWVGLCGFRVAYGRPEEGFAYLQRERLQVMLETIGPESWATGALEPPFGRGLNLQMEVSRLSPIEATLAAAKWPLFRSTEERWYRVGDTETGQRQLLVQDPDGYLLRFCEVLGERPFKSADATKRG